MLSTINTTNPILMMAQASLTGPKVKIITSRLGKDYENTIGTMLGKGFNYWVIELFDSKLTNSLTLGEDFVYLN